MTHLKKLIRKKIVNTPITETIQPLLYYVV